MTKSLSEVKENLIKVRDLISDPNRWTIGSFARNKNGLGVVSTSNDACSWCLIGALQKVTNFDRSDETAALSAIGKTSYGIADFNDSHQHYEVIDFLNEAINSCQ